MKKIIIGCLVLGALLIAAPRARAITIDDLAVQISNLMQQVADLKAELAAAVALTRTTTTTATETRTTTTAPTTETSLSTQTRTVETASPTVQAITRTETATVPTTTADVVKKPTISPTNPTINEVRVCKGGGVSKGWVPCGANTCGNIASWGGACKESLRVSDTDNSGTAYVRVAFGARNNGEVKRIQQLLRKLGYLTNDTQVTGNYLAVTKAAILNFQTENGLKADGIWGPTTKNVLENLYSVANTDPAGPQPAELLLCKGGGVSKGWVPCGAGLCGVIARDGGACKFSW